MRGGGVGPCVAERAETSLLAGDLRERVQQIVRRARQPVEPGHHEHVAGVELVDRAAKLRPVGLGPARDFADYLIRPVLPECGDLSGTALAVGRYPPRRSFPASDTS